MQARKTRPYVEPVRLPPVTPSYTAELYAVVKGGRVVSTRIMQPHATQTRGQRFAPLSVTYTSLESFSDAEAHVRRQWVDLDPQTRTLLLTGAVDPRRHAQLANGGVIVRSATTGERTFLVDGATHKRMQRVAGETRVPRSIPLEPSYRAAVAPERPAFGGFVDALRGGYAQPASAARYDAFWYFG